jgi:hypothetical protein
MPGSCYATLAVIIYRTYREHGHGCAVQRASDRES